MARKLIPNSQLPARYGCTRECVFRWKKDPQLKFPKPALVVNQREFYDEAELLDWEEDNSPGEREPAVKTEVA